MKNLVQYEDSSSDADSDCTQEHTKASRSLLSEQTMKNRNSSENHTANGRQVACCINVKAVAQIEAVECVKHQLKIVCHVSHLM